MSGVPAGPRPEAAEDGPAAEGARVVNVDKLVGAFLVLVVVLLVIVWAGTSMR